MNQGVRVRIPNGNRTQVVMNNEPVLPGGLINNTKGFTYNATANRLLSTTANSFSYDDEGQLIDKSGTTYGFDYAHRLIQAGNNSYQYDGVGNRLSATRNWNQGVRVNLPRFDAHFSIMGDTVIEINLR